MTESLPGTRRGWEAVGEDQLLHDGWLRIARRTYRLPDGRHADWDLLAVSDVVAVLALTPERSVVCVRQFRPGPDRHVLNIPGGVIDPGESTIEAAARELEEETGFVGTDLALAVTTMQSSSTGQRHVVVARGCRPTGRQRLDEFEDCEVVVVSVDEIRAELRSGRMTGNDLVYLGLDHAGLL